VSRGSAAPAASVVGFHGEVALRFILCLGLLLAAAGLSLPARADAAVGVTTLALTLPDGGRALTVTLWYPAAPGGTSVRVGDSAVFEGVGAEQNAPLAEGRFPVVLVSHGGLRSAPNHGNWLGAELASRGFVAAVVRGPALGPRDAAIAVQEIWRRPADLSAVLTALESDAAWSGHLDRAKVGAVGFFLGGTAVLSLVGAQFDADRFKETCGEAGTGVDCAWFADSGVGLHDVDGESLARSYLDPRITAAVAVDPELTTSFLPESLAAVAVPAEVVNLGRLEAVRPGLRAQQAAAAIPGGRYAEVIGATRFSAFSLCTPKGPAILKEEGGVDAICLEAPGQSRAAIHADLAALIAGALARQWGDLP